MGKLNKNSSVALYLQLAEEIKEQIQSGELSPGDQLMTEGELSEEYDISRITVRNAIKILVEEGILIKQQGKGTFVAMGKKITRNMGIFTGFTQACINDGKKPRTKVLVEELVDPLPSDVRALKIKNGEKVIRILRLRYCDDVPVVLEENRFAQDKYLFLLGENLEGSLYECLEKHKVYISGGTRRVNICYATEEESEEDRLNVPIREPLLLMKDVCMDTNGDIVHTCKSVINPRYYEIVVSTSLNRME